MAVDLGNGLYEEIFVPSREINQTETSKGNFTIFHNVVEKPRSFELNLAFENGFDNALVDRIVNWLFTDYYKEMYFENKENKRMFAIMSGDSSLVHNGLEQGYFTVNVQTNSPYLYSPVKSGSKIITTSDTIAVSNNGHLNAYPVIKFKKDSGGDLEIEIDGRTVKIIHLMHGETVTIDTLRERVETDAIGDFLYDNITTGEIEDLFLKRGDSIYTVTGKGTFSYEFRERYRA